VVNVQRRYAMMCSDERTATAGLPAGCRRSCQGADPGLVAELMARLGHSPPAAAMRYQHAAQGRDREIAALLSKLADNRSA
jgi:hypothetical protein